MMENPESQGVNEEFFSIMNAAGLDDGFDKDVVGQFASLDAVEVLGETSFSDESELPQNVLDESDRLESFDSQVAELQECLEDHLAALCADPSVDMCDKEVIDNIYANLEELIQKDAERLSFGLGMQIITSGDGLLVTSKRVVLLDGDTRVCGEFAYMQVGPGYEVGEQDFDEDRDARPFCLLAELEKACLVDGTGHVVEWLEPQDLALLQLSYFGKGIDEIIYRDTRD